MHAMSGLEEAVENADGTMHVGEEHVLAGGRAANISSPHLPTMSIPRSKLLMTFENLRIDS
jgi:hypothetical protein